MRYSKGKPVCRYCGIEREDWVVTGEEVASSDRKLYSELWLAKPFALFTCNFPCEVMIYTIPT